MKRFLFKFFFVLFALIAALPAQAKTVFLRTQIIGVRLKPTFGTALQEPPGQEMT